MIPNNNTNQILVENKELKFLKQMSFSLKKLLVQTENKNKALKSKLKKQIKRAERSEDDATVPGQKSPTTPLISRRSRITLQRRIKHL